MADLEEEQRRQEEWEEEERRRQEQLAREVEEELKVIVKLFSCSTQLSMEFQLLIKKNAEKQRLFLPLNSQMLYLSC